MFITDTKNLSSNIYKFRITFLVLLLIVFPQNTLFAWNTLTHIQLSQIAFNHLPVSVQEELLPYTQDIYDGAVAPDLYLQDWQNHDLNIHGAENEKKAAVRRIIELYDSIRNNLADPAISLSLIAYDMGLLSHYLADLNQPLHTDELSEEMLFHNAFESDVFYWQDQFVFMDKGSRFHFDPAQIAIESAERANRFYSPISLSYLEKGGFNNSVGITRVSLQNTIDTIRDVWLTLWLRAKSSQTNLALWTNQKNYHPGEAIRVLVSILQGKNQPVVKSDLYIAATAPSGELWFLNEQLEFVKDSIPRHKKWFNVDSQIELFNVLIWPENVTGLYKIHALLVKQGADPLDHNNWLSNVAASQFEVNNVQDIHLNELNDELYLFPASHPGNNKITTIPLQRWDIIFVGDLKASAYNEDNVNVLIPGDYDHILIYLGRDQSGIPYAVEMTYSLENEIVNLRLLHLPEFYTVLPGSDSMPIPIITKPIWEYNNRWAKRLVPSELEKVLKNEKELLHKIETHWRNKFEYHLEYSWSGDFNDKQIYLVDDGLNNGASCTDYWLTLFENIAGVCIHHARINAHDLTDYYLNDPVVSQSPIPESLNPFSFMITSSELINTLNFKLVDPPAHIFSCDTTAETGVAIPSRLINSPQLEEIIPALEINNWP